MGESSLLILSLEGNRFLATVNSPLVLLILKNSLSTENWSLSRSAEKKQSSEFFQNKINPRSVEILVGGAFEVPRAVLVGAFISTKKPHYSSNLFFFIKMKNLTLYTTSLKLNLLSLHYFTDSTHRISPLHIFLGRTFTTSKNLIRKLKIFRRCRYQNFCDIISSKNWGRANSKSFCDTHVWLIH